MLKRLAAIALLVTLPSIGQPPVVGKTITITAGTAIRVLTDQNRTVVNSLLIQVDPGATGLVYILSAAIGETCTAARHTVATIAPGDGTLPGGSYQIDLHQYESGFDVRLFCVDGSNSGDTVKVSWVPRG